MKRLMMIAIAISATSAAAHHGESAQHALWHASLDVALIGAALVGIIWIARRVLKSGR